MDLLYWVLCVLIGLLPAVLVYRRDRKRNVPLQWLPALLRFFTCFLTAALLLAPALPATRTEEEKPLLIWLQDNSASMRTALGKDSAAYRNEARQLWDQWKDDYTLIPFTFGSSTGRDSLFTYRDRSTDMAQALQSVTEQYQDQNIGAIILAGDGVFNEGLDPLYAPLGSAVPVYTIGIGDTAQPRDIGISRVYANKTVAWNSSFELIVDVRAEKLAGLSTGLSLMHNGRNEAQASVRVDKDRFTAVLRFEVKATEKGFQRYTVVVPPVEGEPNTLNNRTDFYVEVVDEEVRILILAQAPHPDIAAIRAALESVPQYKVDVRIGGGLPADPGSFHLLIAHQLPASAPLAALQVPRWYIVGRQTSLPLLNRQQQLVAINGGGNPNDVLPMLNSSFSYFTLPANIKEVLAKLPPLQAPYGNYQAAPDGQVLMRQQIGSVATDYPLWIFRHGPVPEAVLCAEGLWRWRLYEFKNTGRHEVVDELIRQTVSLLQEKKDKRPFRVFMDKYIFSDNEPVNLYAELRNANGELVNTADVKLLLSDSAGKSLSYTMEKSGSSYRLNAGLLAPGHYRYKGSASYNGKAYTAEGAFIVESVPLEQLRTYADFELLSKLAANTGGRFFTRKNMAALTDSLRQSDTVKPVLHTEKTYTELISHKWLFFLIFLLAAAEWLLRKYRNI